MATPSKDSADGPRLSNLRSITSTATSGPGAAPKSLDPPGAGFFSLPKKVRDDVYGRVLALRHPVDLFRDPGGPVEAFIPERPRQLIAPLLVNRQMSKEAGAILYYTNTFVTDELQRQGVLLEAFLSIIGPTNCGSLSHLTMNFPAIVDSPEGYKLRDDGAYALTLVRTHCTNLEVLEFLHSSTRSIALDGTLSANPENAADALSSLDVLVNALDSPSRIIIRVCGETPRPQYISAMQGFGWLVYFGRN